MISYFFEAKGLLFYKLSSWVEVELGNIDEAKWFISIFDW